MTAQPSAWAPEPWTVAPSFLTHPEFDFTAGYRVADFVSALTFNGEPFVPDVNQRNLLAMAFAGPPGTTFTSGKWAASTLGIIAPRQNVKTSAMFMATLGACFILNAQRVTWSAHVFNPTTTEAFEDFQRIIDENPALSRRVRAIRTASGREKILFTNGASLRFLARSKGAGRGTGSDLIVLDEAYALTPEEIGALVPTKSARPNAQTWYLSSAGRLESAQLRQIRDSGRRGAPRFAYAEWCGDSARPDTALRCRASACLHEYGTPGCLLDDRDEWQRANPALGVRIDVEAIEDERAQMTPAEFARERLGWWDEAKSGRVIPLGRYAACHESDEDAAVIDGGVAVFVDVALDRSQSVIAVTGANGRDVAQFEIAAMDAGTAWVSERVAAILEHEPVLALGARAAGPVASLLPELAGLADDADVEFVKVGSSDFAGMCGQFFDAVMAANVAHLDDPRVRAALEAAKRHQVLDSWTWERTAVDVDAAPLVAVTGAHALYHRFRDTPVDYDLSLSFH